MPKLLIIVNDVPFFVSHRLPIAMAASKEGYEVVVAAPDHPDAEKIRRTGIAFVDLPLPRKRGAIWREMRAMLSLFRLVASQRPDVAHLITAKPIIFGGVVCRAYGVPVLAAISGLGHVFIARDLKSRILRAAILAGYRLSLKRDRALAIFQNRDNLEIFRRANIIDERYLMIKGSGVDLNFEAVAPIERSEPIVILPARLLWTKGVGEFVEAARILRMRGHRARFVLAGKNDPGNPGNIEIAQLEEWQARNDIEWIGFREDIMKVLADADIVVLPSYLEGLPKTLIDAAAVGRPCVTTNVPGCRDAIVEGETGLLCRVLDADDLADKIALLLEDRERRLRMGTAARCFAEREFDIRAVVKLHLESYRRLRGKD